MNWIVLLIAFSAGVSTVGLIVIGRLLFASRVYLPRRAFIFFAATVISYLLLGYTFVRVLWGEPFAPDWALVFITVFATGVVGSLLQQITLDRTRQAEAQKLMEQWKLATKLAQKRSTELEMLYTVTRDMASSLDLREVLQAVVDHTLQLGEADLVTIFVCNRETGELTDYHVTATKSEALKDLPPPRPEGLTATVARTGEPAFISAAQRHPMYRDGGYPNLGAIAGLPLHLEAEIIGVMNVGYTRPHEFNDDETRMLGALADAAALAVHNATLHERIAGLAVTDELTGLPNRRRFLEGVRAEMQRARRYGHPLALLMIDLDHLKWINDVFGHAGGDIMLRGVAHCLRSHVRETDLVARLGGDEFAVLLLETSGATAVTIAERIRAAVETYLGDLDGVAISSTVSIGVVIPGLGELEDMAALLQRADEALYQSKEMGRNRVTVAEPLPSKGIDAPVNS